MNINTFQYNDAELVSTLTRKGQVTIPSPIRKLLGLKPNSKVAFLQKKDGVHIAVPRYTLDTIRGAVPALSRKYSEKEIREIAIESHLEKYKMK
jgi:AbrB family looped-hinge helix DNA binding protein